MFKQIILILVLTILVVVAVGYGIHLSGSPSENKAVRYDGIRVQDFTSIRTAIENYYTDNSRLPSSFADLIGVRSKTGLAYLKKEPKDPKTKQSYTYQPFDLTQYKLCAVFETSSDEIAKRKTGLSDNLTDVASQTEDNSHPKGQYCLTKNISKYIQDNYSNQAVPGRSQQSSYGNQSPAPLESTSAAF